PELHTLSYTTLYHNFPYFILPLTPLNRLQTHIQISSIHIPSKQIRTPRILARCLLTVPYIRHFHIPSKPIRTIRILTSHLLTVIYTTHFHIRPTLIRTVRLPTATPLPRLGLSFLHDPLPLFTELHTLSYTTLYHHLPYLILPLTSTNRF